MNDLAAHDVTIQDHLRWLNKFDAELSCRYTSRLASEPESAVCEAILREVLCGRVASIEPAENTNEGGLDFLCHQQEQKFYVECACLMRSTVNRETSLADFCTGAQSYSHLTQEFRNAIRRKGTQPGKYPDTRRVLAIRALHFSAGALCFDKNSAEMVLVEPQIAWHVNTRTGETIGDTFQITDLKKAAFLKPVTAGVAMPSPARQHASAVLLCGFGGVPRSICGILNCDAAVEFDPRLRPDIDFCRQFYDEMGTSVIWV